MPTHAGARAFLESIAKRQLLITYQELANALRILPPHSIHRVTEALERLMEEDAAADRPFGGRIEGSGRINLSTLHSSKGREFDVVIMFAMNADVIPSRRDKQRADALREACRLFYVGVTRPRKQLYVCCQKGNHSPWVKELYDRVHLS